MHTYVAGPPDWSPTPIPSGPLPPGAVLLVELAGDVVAVRAGIAAHHGSPWCPVCVVVPDAPVNVGILQAMAEFPAQALFVERSPGNARPSGSAIVAALRSAPLPRPEEIAEYIVSRTGRREVADILPACLWTGPDERGDSGAPSRSTVSRRLSTFGPLTARDWRAVSRLIHALHCPPHREATIDEIAWAADLDPHTLRQSSTRYLGLAAVDAAELPGWTWKLETVLRQFGYVTIDPSNGRSRRRSDEYQLV